MRHVKAIAAAGQLTTFVENPEITAMAAICEILQALPDDAARMRVMRWSFGRFGDEFKRPLLEAHAEPAEAPVPAPLRLTAVAPLRPVPPAVFATLPLPTAITPMEDEEASDLADQISELADLFPQPARRLKSLS